ncbi:hypothetical protein [Streptomyces sp. NPDC002599]|uniref:hypothetical protein n=1 Tax=Streptomyces sp. NPDC002599 TaxID=3154421 RepID=UPI00331C0107
MGHPVGRCSGFAQCFDLAVVGASFGRSVDDRIIGVSEDAIVQIVNGCHQTLESPWEPEIIPVPLPETDGQMILVVRVDPAKASRPLLVQGAAPIRLYGRNAVADRAGLARLINSCPAAACACRMLSITPKPHLTYRYRQSCLSFKTSRAQ